MEPDLIKEWIDQILPPLITAIGLIFVAWLSLRGKRGETGVAHVTAQEAAIAARWDDASDLAKYLREQIESEVERKVAPIREELARVTSESHEMHNVVRGREVQLWLWDQRGREGELPLLPTPIMERLGLSHLVSEHPPRPPL